MSLQLNASKVILLILALVAMVVWAVSAMLRHYDNQVDLIGKLGCGQIISVYELSSSLQDRDEYLAGYIAHTLREYYPEETFEISPGDARAAAMRCG